MNEAYDGREAIAIDGSSHNEITDNVFINNRYAGIALYKNCGEGSTPTPRTVGANYNIIERNEFYKHDNSNRGAAVVIASRQGLDPSDPYDAFGNVACADDKLTFSGVHRYRDIARHNVVRRNAFAFNTTAIRVRDSFNHIESNTFLGKSWSDKDEDPPETVYALHDVLVEGALLKGVGEPVIGVTVINNIIMTETKTAGENFVQKDDAKVLFANNVNRYYQCLPDAIAPGNLCNPLTASKPSAAT